MNLKKDAAQKAVSFIKDNSTIGLGAGSTMAFMAEFLAAEIQNGLSVKILTSSFTTRQLLMQKGFFVTPMADISELDIYFDGCDQVDHNLHALKSGGGIHTHEKLLASMAKEFILVVDEAKYVPHFDNNYPLVIEFLPEALGYVPAKIRQLFNGIKITLRLSDKKDGPAITDNGNYLLDVWFDKFPEPQALNQLVKDITGVVETSLFYNLAHKAIVAGADGIKIIENHLAPIR